MTDETHHIARAAASLGDPYAALSQHLHGDGAKLPKLDEIDRLKEENGLLRYVLDGVAAAIDTGRNEPLHIWRGQIDIVRAALAEGGHDAQ